MELLIYFGLGLLSAAFVLVAAFTIGFTLDIVCTWVVENLDMFADESRTRRYSELTEDEKQFNCSPVGLVLAPLFNWVIVLTTLSAGLILVGTVVYRVFNGT